MRHSVEQVTHVTLGRPIIVLYNVAFINSFCETNSLNLVNGKISNQNVVHYILLSVMKFMYISSRSI